MLALVALEFVPRMVAARSRGTILGVLAGVGVMLGLSVLIKV
jgi:hypothetical protein